MFWHKNHYVTLREWRLGAIATDTCTERKYGESLAYCGRDSSLRSE